MVVPLIWSFNLPVTLLNWSVSFEKRASSSFSPPGSTAFTTSSALGSTSSTLAPKQRCLTSNSSPEPAPPTPSDSSPEQTRILSFSIDGKLPKRRSKMLRSCGG